MAGVPSVRVEGSVLTDYRYGQLGRLIGTTRYDAIGRMYALWQSCTLHGLHTLPEDVVAEIVDPNALIKAGLGERTDDGIRIRGTEGRIEWFARLQESGRKSAAKRWRKRPKGTQSKPNGSPNGSPIDHPLGGPKDRDREPTPDPISGSGKGKARKGKGEPHPLPDDWSPTPEHAKRANETGLDLVDQAQRFRLNAETNGRLAVSWNAAFTTWLMNAPAFAQGLAQRSGKAPPRDRARELWDYADRLEAEEKAEP